MEVSFATMIYLIINFLLLVAILWHFLYKPVGKLLREREERIDKNIETAKKDREDAESLRKEYEEKMVQLKRDTHDAIEKAIWQGEQEQKEIISKAKDEAAEIIQRAEKQVQDDQAKAWEVLKDDMIDISMLAASKVLERTITDEDQKKLFEKFVNEVQMQEFGEANESS